MDPDLARIADAFERIATVLEKYYEQLYPSRNIAPATVAKARYPDEEEKPAEEAGEVFPTFVGPREAALLKTQNARQKG